jgi:uncharacterized protein YegL
MDMDDLDLVSFADNLEPRVALVLLLDQSASMQEALEPLRDGLGTLRDALREDRLAARRVEISVISYNSRVELLTDSVGADLFEVPALTAEGMTHLGEALEAGIDHITRQKERYRRGGIDYYQPWLMCLTDGVPNGNPAVLQRATQRLHEEEARRGLSSFFVGVEGYDHAVLSQIAPSSRPPLPLKGVAFRELFLWVSASVSSVSVSQAGSQLALPPVDSWVGVRT